MPEEAYPVEKAVSPEQIAELNVRLKEAKLDEIPGDADPEQVGKARTVLFDSMHGRFLKEINYDIKLDAKRYWKLFSDFDEDSSGSVTREEMYAMIESLGMAMKKIEMNAMIDAADADKSGTIEFDEFYNVMESSANLSPELARVIKRKMNSTELKWRDDRKGAGVSIEGKLASFSGEAGKSAVAMLGPFIPGDDKPKANKASILLEVDAPDGHVWVGCVGRNFNPEGDHWSQDFGRDDKDKMLNEKAALVTACCTSDGRMVKHGTVPPSGGMKFGVPKAKGVELDINMDDRTMIMKFLDETNHYEPHQEVELNDMKVDIGIAVCFGPVKEGGRPSTVRLVGSSAESNQRRHRRASKDLWEDDNVQGVAVEKATGPAFVSGD